MQCNREKNVLFPHIKAHFRDKNLAPPINFFWADLKKVDLENKIIQGCCIVVGKREGEMRGA